MRRRAVVAGHLCLDLFPTFESPPDDPRELFSPGRLFEIESSTVAAGGSVANTGGALLRLGVDALLVGRIGEDGFGGEVERALGTLHHGAASGLHRVAAERTSYSVVLSAPRFDRIFFHFAGANDHFTSADVTDGDLAGRDLLHFGYPTAMRSIYENDGEELLRLLSRAKDAGLTTSLDISYPQPGSRAARVDWRGLLERVLPWVDFFLPGLDELSSMLGGGIEASPGGARLREVADWAIGAGCAVCVLKLGADGLYVRTSDDRRRIAAAGRARPAAPEEWTGRELLEPCFIVDAAGTTGAGDVTVAGFLAGVLAGSSVEKATRIALAAGAASVERVDAASGLPDLASLEARLAGGWKQRRGGISLER